MLAKATNVSCQDAARRCNGAAGEDDRTGIGYLGALVVDQRSLY
jgi:hypothetical protein